MKAAQKERFIKQKRNQQQSRRDGMYGRNWTPITTLQAAVSTGKRDHSSMVTAPQRQQLKRTTEGARSNTKRWTQHTIISTNKQFKQYKSKMKEYNKSKSHYLREQWYKQSKQYERDSSFQQELILFEDDPSSLMSTLRMILIRKGLQGQNKSGGDIRCSCCQNNRFPFSAIGELKRLLDDA